MSTEEILEVLREIRDDNRTQFVESRRVLDQMIAQQNAAADGLTAESALYSARVLRWVAQQIIDACEPEIAGMDGGYVDGYRAASVDSATRIRKTAGELGEAAKTYIDRAGAVGGTPETTNG